MFYTFDGGENWRQPSIGMPRAARSLLLTGKQLLAGTDRGLFHSFDYGDSWMRLNNDHQPIVNAMTVHQGNIVVAEQNGMGVLSGNTVKWSTMTSDWALLQLHSAGAYVYATNSKGEVFRSKDGINWEAKPILSMALNCDSLPDALWHGFTAELPTGQTTNTLHETSRGWVALVGGGC
ncbi:MAG: hypothetical protein AAF597_13390 [Bacteroidota bacterium]